MTRSSSQSVNSAVEQFGGLLLPDRLLLYVGWVSNEDGRDRIEKGLASFREPQELVSTSA